jgi:NADH-quinone oxidoreductase subunit L
VSLSGVELWTELLLSTVIALTGITLAYFVYLKHKVDPRRIELSFFANGWYIDRTITNFMGGVGRRSFELIAMFDKVVIDGAVNGVGRATRGGAIRLRTVQNGYVRWYALMIGVGAVLVMAFVLTQVSF